MEEGNVVDPRLLKCGFAKLQGNDFEFYMRKYDILLGRKSKSTELDVVLGENTNVSRNHARIRYSFEKGVFELVVLGKNGMLIQMGDKSFFFLLPKSVE